MNSEKPLGNKSVGQKSRKWSITGVFLLTALSLVMILGFYRTYIISDDIYFQKYFQGDQLSPYIMLAIPMTIGAAFIPSTMGIAAAALIVVIRNSTVGIFVGFAALGLYVVTDVIYVSTLWDHMHSIYPNTHAVWFANVYYAGNSGGVSGFAFYWIYVPLLVATSVCLTKALR